MKFKIFIVSCLLFFGGASWGLCSLIDKTELMGQFYKANAAYKSNDYKEALKLYTQIVDAGYASAAVYYNMGNSFIKEGQLGRGLLWYERALLLSPRDGDVLANVAFSQGKIKNAQPQGPKNWAQRIFIHLPLVAEDEIVLGLALLGVVMSITVLAGLYLRWRFKKTFVVLVVMGVLFVFHVFALVLRIDLTRNQSIVLETVEVKYEPEKEATTHYTAYEGWKVRYLRESDGWVKIERPDGLQGWIPKEKLEMI